MSRSTAPYRRPVLRSGLGVRHSFHWARGVLHTQQLMPVQPLAAAINFPSFQGCVVLQACTVKCRSTYNLVQVTAHQSFPHAKPPREEIGHQTGMKKKDCIVSDSRLHELCFTTPSLISCQTTANIASLTGVGSHKYSAMHCLQLLREHGPRLHSLRCTLVVGPIHGPPCRPSSRTSDGCDTLLSNQGHITSRHRAAPHGRCIDADDHPGAGAMVQHRRTALGFQHLPLQCDYLSQDAPCCRSHSRVSTGRCGQLTRVGGVRHEAPPHCINNAPRHSPPHSLQVPDGHVLLAHCL